MARSRCQKTMSFAGGCLQLRRRKLSFLAPECTIDVLASERVNSDPVVDLLVFSQRSKISKKRVISESPAALHFKAIQRVFANIPERNILSP